MLNRVLVNHNYPFEIPTKTGTIEFVATAAAYRGKGPSILEIVKAELMFAVHIATFEKDTDAIIGEIKRREQCKGKRAVLSRGLAGVSVEEKPCG